jgi:hypothetical protein
MNEETIKCFGPPQAHARRGTRKTAAVYPSVVIINFTLILLYELRCLMEVSFCPKCNGKMEEGLMPGGSILEAREGALRVNCI